MKALVKNNQIKLYKQLPETWDGPNGHILNFRQATEEVLRENNFYNVVKPGYNPMTQTKGGLYFDQANSIVTYDVTDIDFDQDIDILDEEGNVTGTEKRYKIADIKASKISEIKNKAGELLKPTDWQVLRKTERSIDIDADVATERAGILTEADRLEAEVNAFTNYADVLQYRVQFFPSDDEII
jgi:hypothetical protein